MHLYNILASLTSEWRSKNYYCEEYPAISEILEWISNPDVNRFHLRQPQIRAIETYWYLRLVAGTPKIFDLYNKLFPKRSDLLSALGISKEAFERVDYDIDSLWNSIRNDDVFTKEFQLEALRESLSLGYPSYILALAMGAGKTVLIGAIFASEFAMAQEYPNANFVENALVFAPGKTIIESLRELAEMHYEAVLPRRMYKAFSAALKLTFTRDGDPTIPIISGSSFNVIVTNTEKIRIQKETIRKKDFGDMFPSESGDEARSEIANLRLQAIASLPKLAIFSDEAHHTYGQQLDKDLKKVRKTVDYLNNPHPLGSPEHEAHESKLICVVNTTGTPYFQHQPLRDVVIWYGLSEGIQDGILKQLSDNIYGFDFNGNIEDYISYVVTDFFKTYGDVVLPDGTPAKMAIFFPKTDDVREFRPVVEEALLSLGLPTTLVLEHHTKNDNKPDFDRFKSKNSPHRIVLLVDRGVEGWNAPCLFAVSLARRLKSSNNFVLQAASRCLRQIPGNRMPARIYLSKDNKDILDQQLRETYGESYADLTGSGARRRIGIITIKKVNLPPVVVRKNIHHIMRKDIELDNLHLTLPNVETTTYLEKVVYEIGETPGRKSVLQQEGEREIIHQESSKISLYHAAEKLASNYHFDAMKILMELRNIYPTLEMIPVAHFNDLAEQIERQLNQYELIDETVEVALALIKPDGFNKSIDPQGNEIYTAEISYSIDREQLLAEYSKWQSHAGSFGFHYDPYNFDSKPECNFFDLVLGYLNQHPGEVEDIYFTGGLTDPQKTDFFIEYRGTDNKWHPYTPDFVIRRKDGKCLIIEIKKAHDREHPIDGEYGSKAIATQKWVDINPDCLKYQMIFVDRDEVGYEQLDALRNMIEPGKRK